jgi:hypothetical protein
MNKVDFSALEQKREENNLEFKESFDASSLQEWCEIIKDIVALANSGGGLIVFGVNDDGESVDCDIDSILAIDNAAIIDKINTYTGIQFDRFQMYEYTRDGERVAILSIQTSDYPMVFICEGGYRDHRGKDKRAFSKGTVYFRHGAKSEPGTTRDIENFVSRKISEIKAYWFDGIKQVVEAPVGYKVQVLPPEVYESTSPNAISIKITNDPDAQVYRKGSNSSIKLVNDDKAPSFHAVNTDELYPHKFSAVVGILNKALGEEIINRYDILSLIYAHNLKKHPNLYFRSKFATTSQFSDAFIAWVVEEYKKDRMFFERARKKYRDRKRSTKYRTFRNNVYFCTYIDLRPKDSVMKKYNIPEDKVQFRIICKATSIDEASAKVLQLTGFDGAFRNTPALKATDNEILLCKSKDIIIEITDENYIDIIETM